MKDLMLIELYECYKELLTVHQKRIFEENYILDLSLGEIAENEGISRQSVNDSLKKAEKQLRFFEAKLSKVSNKNKLSELLKEEKIENLKEKLKIIIKEI